ncbi:hypothetical protein K7432_015264 [Basidiobolus ranarum]|uniref:Uncharacterized protein n=1 Tax=Basidiobolus ranarum TaxID=34480 RepID=A0ABR2WGC3_9FUNG
MGEDWWLWFVPYVNSIGNGHSFRTSENGRQGDGTTDMCRLNRNNAVLDSRYDMELPPIPRFEPLEPVSP